MIPGLGRSPGEGIGYPRQYSWAPLVVQTIKNPPATQETWVRSLGWEDPLAGVGWGGVGHGNPLQYSCLENPHGQRSLVDYSLWGHKELDMPERLSTQHCVLGFASSSPLLECHSPVCHSSIHYCSLHAQHASPAPSPLLLMTTLQGQCCCSPHFIDDKLRGTEVS